MMSREKQAEALAELRAFITSPRAARTAAEIAVRFGISKPTAYARLRLLNLQVSVERMPCLGCGPKRGPKAWAYYIRRSAA